MPPLDATQIIERVRQAKSSRDLMPLLDDLRETDPQLLFRTLFPIAVRAQGLNQGPVAFSACALHALNPPCLIPVDEAVTQLLAAWDISIQEVPWYLVKQFGQQAVLAATDRLSASEPEKPAILRLGTIKYWVAAFREGA